MDTALQQAIEYQRKGELDQAVRVLQAAVAGGSKNSHIYYLLGAILENVGKLKEAEGALHRAVELNSGEPDFWFVYANVLSKRGESQAALNAYNQCVKLEPENYKALVNIALILNKHERYELAAEIAEKATQAKPSERKTWLAWISALGHSRQFDKAYVVLERANEQFPNDPELILNRGNLLNAEGRIDEAYPYYQKAVELMPESVDALLAMGNYHAQHKQPLDALPFHQKTLKKLPQHYGALHGLGFAYLQAGYPRQAVDYLMKALNLQPDSKNTFGCLLLALNYLDNLNEEELYEFHKRWAHKLASVHYPQHEPYLNYENARLLRVGFISPDFKNHSVSRFLKKLLRNIPSAEFEVYCYSDVSQPDEQSAELQSLGGQWRHTYTFSDTQLTLQIQQDNIDILVDLAGHTGNNRLFVFARKPAPIEISWLGYPNTTGLTTMDYRLSDSIADPAGQTDRLSSEKIIRLSGGFHCYEPPIELPEVAELPASKNGHITFGSFNNQAKLNDTTLKLWVALMKKLPHSRLILKNYSLRDERNRTYWKARFEKLGLDAGRIRYVGYVKDIHEHFSLYNEIDIALDTFPYNGTTTTCEALWMGIPVLTLAGNTQRSRTAASLLTHSGLEDWVACSAEEWERLGVAKATSLQELANLRKQLRQQVSDSSIGDGPQFAAKFFAQLKAIAHEPKNQA